MTTLADHWNAAYSARDEQALTWFEACPVVSLRLVQHYLPKGGALVDIGCGASRLVDYVLDEDLGRSVILDLSATALGQTQARLADRAKDVTFVETNVLDWVPGDLFDLWHDRAAFHFLTNPTDQSAYLDTMAAALRPGAYAIISTFASTGPEKCSGLPVARYAPADLASRLSDLRPGWLEPVQAELHAHKTPLGNVQDFQTSVFRVKG